jgi:hypothetical protein
MGGWVGERPDKLDGWEYIILKFAFEAAKNIRFPHSNLLWGASLTPILPCVPLPQHVSDL